MNRVGIIGGVGPESTILYYKGIIKEFQKRLNTKDLPRLIINSVNMMEMASYLNDKEYSKLIEYLLREVKVLENAGADYAAIASNTPHIVFNELQGRTTVKLISIVTESCLEVKREKFTKAILLGTKSTMSAGFYQQEAQKFDLEIFVPSEEEQVYINEIYFRELLYNEIREGTKHKIKDIAKKIHEQKHVDCLILGGTELSLLIKQDDLRDLKIFDSTDIHIQSIVDKLVS